MRAKYLRPAQLYVMPRVERSELISLLLSGM
jgi:hypothetical protein